ncbi:hypothetical protein CAPTEDRAFT_161501 [Capitella teleta]|uniref:Transcription initiation factor TFIID subunit 9 n=1 Tax=Capitella teleta TaxID=283909 RepID=R7U3L5_CAPTE|nr:hypothetical protein CAPTEDRAFT_161501 [Capitella teleta]|eukprot:ELT97765.1 hypothetical protein CAPTEDRAFT_161501 [Capitella teleta]
MTSQPKTVPRDIQVMSAILKDVGVNDHEPRVLNQMMEFAYRYVTDVLDDARVYSSHSKKKAIDEDDVRLAVQYKLEYGFTTPPPKDLLLDVARSKNSVALPLIKPYIGPKLPPDRYCLCAPNYKLRSLKKPKYPQSGIVQVTQRHIQGSKTAGGQMSGQPLTLVSSRPVSQPAMTIRQNVVPVSHPQNPVPIIRLTSGNQSQTSVASSAIDAALKRKRDEDDDYDN